MKRESSSPEAYRSDVGGELGDILEAVREVMLEFVYRQLLADVREYRESEG